MNIEIANRLVQLRKQHGLSQEELAARLGLSRQAVSKWERAEASPDTDNLILLSRVYGVSIDELLRTEDEIPEPREETGFTVTVNGKSVHVNTGGHVGLSAEDGDDDDDDGDEGDGDEGGSGFTVTVNGKSVQVNAGGHVSFSAEDGDDDDDGDEGNGDEGGSGSGKNAFLKAFPYPVFVTVVYLCIGSIWGLWHPGWIVFLTIPVYYPTVRWFSGERKHVFLRDFPYPILVTIAFLLLGCVWGLWHPAWILYLTIPIYYPLVHAADRRYRAKREDKGYKG